MIQLFATKKWIEVYDQSGGNYNVNKEIRIKTLMLISDFYDFSDAYVVAKGTITLDAENNANKRNKSVAFKNNAPFINCISRINGVQIDKAEDLDAIMPMYNLLEYTKNYRKRQEVYAIIIETNKVILFILILNLLDTKQTLLEKHQIIMMH